MQGPKYRIGEVAQGTILKQGASVVFDQSPIMGDATRLPLPHPEIFAALQPGSRLLMDDGKLALEVSQLFDTSLTAIVKTGGPVLSRKGVNVPDIKIDTQVLTPKDIKDLEFALLHGADWIALSFVQSVSDIIAAKTIIAGRAQLMAKIEKPAALNEIVDIIHAADAIMIARGDLGVELEAAEVPSVQKRLIHQCRRVGKPVVVATQMLESMITSPTPTRAEASDVAGAVFDGADAVMLSAETAIGDNPVEAVLIMANIIKSAQAHIMSYPYDGPSPLEVEPSVYHAVAKAAVALAQTIEAKAIIAYSASGNTAVRISRERPCIPFFVPTPHEAVERKLSVLYGANTIHQKETDFETALTQTKAILLEKKIVRKNDHIVVVAGIPFGKAGSTNSIRVTQI